jgi:predicted PurR-regulated permease PerM
MTDDLSSPMLRRLKGAACLVIIMWGIKAASDVLLILLLSLFFAYVIVPLPRWLIKCFNLRTQVALGVTMILVGTLYVVISFLLYWTFLRLKVKLPAYEAAFAAIYGQVFVFLNAHGLRVAIPPSAVIPDAGRIADFAVKMLPSLAGLLSDRLLMWVLSFLILIRIVEEDESKRGAFAATLIEYGGDVQRFIGISAKTGGITALANFVILVSLGVDFPVLWCVLYFILQFIPSLGFIIALVPPVLLELLVGGWGKALLVAGALVLTQMLADYLLLPMFTKKGLHVSLLEIMLSLIVWGSLLGPLGGVLAIPLTLVLRKYIEGFSKAGTLNRATTE